MQDLDATRSALLDALAALDKAERAVQAALAGLGLTEGVKPAKQLKPGQRLTSIQIMAVLGEHSRPMTLQEIADGVAAIRGQEDQPKGRYQMRVQELCRTALGRLADSGAVRRVHAESEHERMRFIRTSADGAA